MSEQAEKDFNIKPGEKTRSYKEFGFSVMIPVVTQIHDCIRVKFSIKKQPGNNVAMIIDKFQITDKLGRKYETAPPDVFIAGGSSQKQVLLDVSYIGQAPMWRDARLKIILCDQNGKKYEICYKSDSNRTLMLEFAIWNAVFPVILIDDSVVWYGVPDARLMFKDGNWGYSTVCKTIFRITGEHTVELLKSLSDLEYRTVEHQRKPLLEKSSKDTVNIDEDSDGKEAAGLSKFAEEYSKCPKCKSAMKLMRSRAGKVFLKCPSCANMEYLTPDFTNWYISKKYLRCPKCNSGLRAGLGSYGIYVKCDNGHFIKPDEI